MQVKMVGIDHNLADLDIREKFSFTSDEIDKGLAKIKENDNISGAVIISTCNRTELWLSYDKEKENDVDAKNILLNLKAEKIEDEEVFLERKGKDAIEHLMVTACGINSKVFGEDQILTQIREALDRARDVNATDSTLEKVFLNSVTAGKKVKDSVRLTTHSPSVATSGIKELKDVYGSLKDKVVLIIGNGNMARLIGEHLVDNGSIVYMTKRKRHHKTDENDYVPIKNSIMIGYDERYEYLKDADIVISATLSPHNTITLNELKNHKVKEPAVWLDLAVPRDIEKSIEKEYDIKIWDIDNMSEDMSKDISDSLSYAKEIIGGYRDDIIKWIEFRKLVPTVNKILKNVKKDIYYRCNKEINALDVSEDSKKDIENLILDISNKAFSKVLFGMKETLSEDSWEESFKAILESSKKDTIKS